MRLFFWKKKKPAIPLPSPDAPAKVDWHKDERGYYRRLLPLNGSALGLDGVGGVYAIWNRGLHAKWIYVGATDDLARSLEDARDNVRILAFEAAGGIYVTWAPFREEYRDGAAAYLRGQLSPEIAESLPSDRPFAAPHADGDGDADEDDDNADGPAADAITPVPIQPPR